jgi:hypothetical protein
MALFAAIFQWDQEGPQLITYGIDEFPYLAAVPAVITLLPFLV